MTDTDIKSVSIHDVKYDKRGCLSVTGPSVNIIYPDDPRRNNVWQIDYDRGAALEMLKIEDFNPGDFLYLAPHGMFTYAIRETIWFGDDGVYHRKDSMASYFVRCEITNQTTHVADMPIGDIKKKIKNTIVAGIDRTPHFCDVTIVAECEDDICFIDLDATTYDKYGYIVDSDYGPLDRTIVYDGIYFSRDDESDFQHICKCKIGFMHEIKRDVIIFEKPFDGFIIVGKGKSYQVSFGTSGGGRSHGQHTTLVRCYWQTYDEAICRIKKWKMWDVVPHKFVDAYADVAVCFP